MVAVGIKDGVVEICVSVNALEDVRDYYPEHLIVEQMGEENIGWTHDGVSFTAP